MEIEELDEDKFINLLQKAIWAAQETGEVFCFRIMRTGRGKDSTTLSFLRGVEALMVSPLFDKIIDAYKETKEEEKH